MAATNGLPPPPALDIHHANAAEKWKKFELAWKNYSRALKLHKEDEDVQVGTLLTVVGPEAQDVFTTFEWDNDGDDEKIGPVLEKFKTYCEPRKNVPFERYCFNQRSQNVDESYDQYKTALKKLSEGCDFASITPDEILRDRLVFGIRNNKVRERLLRETSLTLERTDEICRAAEQMSEQLRVVGDTHVEGTTAHAVQMSGKTRHKTTKTAAAEQNQSKPSVECWNCGRTHELRKDACPANGKKCKICGKNNHFAVKCRSAEKGNKPSVRGVELVDGEQKELHVYTTNKEQEQLDDSQLITLKLESGNFLRFQPDTGAQCNVIPLHLYKKATEDYKLSQVKRGNVALRAYGGAKLPVVGCARIKVWRHRTPCLLDCQIVDNAEVRPLLGRRACLGMNIVKYVDSDALNRPETSNAEVHATATQQTTPLTPSDLASKFPKVFSEKTGLLAGSYHIRLDATQQPVQHAPRRVPVALREKVKQELEKLNEEDIITPVTEPTKWISSMVEVVKPNGKIRICLDPRDLNQAVQREHYPLPTIEDISTRLEGAKVFTKCDVRNGFWHVQLDEESSYLTTFHTPFGRYRWKRLPFGINSAPEVFQRKMHELIEGLEGVEVIADDFLIVGFGKTLDEAIRSHDKNLLKFLERCEERGVVLNITKLKLRQKEVPFIGHIASDRGLLVDPTKVRAISEMPAPKDKAAVQRLLGMAQYLSKFLPHLSDMTKPLRELTQKNVTWFWGTAQEEALEDLRQAVTSTPVLRYYSLKEEVTLQCDASQSGLGAAILQQGQPVAYASRALTPTEERYAQIEKELLAIVFACERFEPYIFGREEVNVETDHKPLEVIVLKPLNAAPKRLQRMLLRLQKYDLRVKYKKGTTMHVADTLSRAHLPEVNACLFEEALEKIDHREMLPVSEESWQHIYQASHSDPVMAELRDVIQSGWPNKKTDVPECIRPYYDVRDELTVQGPLVFKRQQLVVPLALRKELIECTHATHIGMEGCVRRARDTLYWPRMSAEIKDFVGKCDICLAHRSNQTKEPLQHHELVTRPWSKVGADLLELDNRSLLVVSDYFSNFIEVANVTQNPTSRKVIKALQDIFARFGIPDTLVTDNGSQFTSAEFKVFAKTWQFEHVTSSPRYPQSNGKAENAVKTVKRLFIKCKTSGQSEYLALLDWRNTPSEGYGTSPAQRLMGRRCKTRLPVAGKLLQPETTIERDSTALVAAKARQQHHYDKSAKALPPLNAGDAVRLKLPGQQTWSPAVCIREAGPRSYEVESQGTRYRRNRRQLIKTEESPPPEPDFELPGTSPPEADLELPETSPAVTPLPQVQASPKKETTPPTVRRSERKRATPVWMKDYVQ